MLHTQGFELLHQAVHLTDNIQQSLRLRLKRAQPIFNYNETTDNNDGLRTQARFLCNENKGLKAFCDNVTALIPPGRECREWVVIASEAGCQQQHRHHDFDPDLLKQLPDNHIPLAVIVGLDPDTKLMVWPGCIRGRVPEANDPGTTITFGPGDVVVFRGDLVHAGAAYPDRANLRVHSYADIPGIQREKNKTYLC